MKGCLTSIIKFSLFILLLALVSKMLPTGNSELKEQLSAGHKGNKPFFAYVTANKLNVRKEPDTSAPVITTLGFGDVVKAIKKEGEWIKVISPVGVGYIAEKYSVNMGRIHKVLENAVSPMTPKDSPRAYAKLGEKRFKDANMLLPVVARLASENKSCKKVTFVTLTYDKTTRGNLWFFADCINDVRVWVSEKDIKSGNRGVASVDMAPDESASKLWCEKQVKRSVNYPATLEIHGFAGYATKVALDGSRTIHLDFTSKNGFGVPIRKTAVCVVTPDRKGTISFINSRY